MTVDPRLLAGMAAYLTAGLLLLLFAYRRRTYILFWCVAWATTGTGLVLGARPRLDDTGAAVLYGVSQYLVLVGATTFAAATWAYRATFRPRRLHAAVLAPLALWFALAPIALWWFDAPLHLGPSYAAIEWAAQPDRTVTVLCGLFAIRAVATWLGVAGGGMGGLFIPLVTQGAIVGSIFEHVVDSPNPHLFPTIGIAAFLGAGYRTPLAGVAFVAEATGETGFLVPALLAAAAAQLVMGGKSFSSYQRNERLPDVEPLSRLAVGDIMSPSADTIDAELGLDAVVATMLRQNRRWAPVVDGNGYAGLIAATDISLVPMAEWPNLKARDVARTDVAPAAPTDTVDAVDDRMRAVHSEAIAVTTSNTVIGVVTLRDLTNIEVLLDRLNNETA